MSAPRLVTVFHRLCAWNDLSSHLPNYSGDCLRLPCSQAQALTSVMSTADLSSDIKVFDYKYLIMSRSTSI